MFVKFRMGYVKFIHTCPDLNQTISNIKLLYAHNFMCGGPQRQLDEISVITLSSQTNEKCYVVVLAACRVCMHLMSMLSKHRHVKSPHTTSTTTKLPLQRVVRGFPKHFVSP